MFGEADLVVYVLKNIDSNGVLCELDDFVIHGDSSKFGAHGTSADK